MHERVKNKLRAQKGLSLLETILAMALGAMIFIPLSTGFSIAIKGWDENTEYSELYQHARAAMERLTRELRYAAGVDRSDPAYLKFYTRTLVDDDWQEELITYWRKTGGGGSYALMRSVNGGDGYAVAGSTGTPAIGISVSSFQWAYLKLLGGTTLNDVQTDDPDGLVDAVAISLTVENTDTSNSVLLHSLVKLRNK